MDDQTVRPTDPFTIDLDSLCSAIVLAYLRTYASSSKHNTLYIPLSNLPHADLALRPELIPVLSRANLKPSDLLTLSDLPRLSQISSKLPAEKTRWILVDHNALQGELGRIYGTRVVGCIDHHDEEGKVPRECVEEPRVVRKSGSCSSLVVEHCREAWDALSKKAEDKESVSWDAELAQLALAPILIDTTNLTDKNKVTPTDIEAVEYLESKIRAEPAIQFNSEEHFKVVSAAKSDIGGLSLPDILRKDYKQWNEAGDVKLGISSVVKDMQFLIDKAGNEEKFFTALEDFCRERDLSVYSIMTTSQKDGKFQRELFVWGLGERGVEAAKKFEASFKEELGLQQWSDGLLDLDDGKQWRRCWWQHRVENSRKQVAPMMRTAIQR